METEYNLTILLIRKVQKNALLSKQQLMLRLILWVWMKRLQSAIMIHCIILRVKRILRVVCRYNMEIYVRNTKSYRNPNKKEYTYANR